jgi:hypothetical protein
MLNRRKSRRVAIALPLQIKLLGVSKHPPTIKTVTTNISPLGISMELPVSLVNGVFFIQRGEQSVNLIRYLVQKNKEVELEITFPRIEKFKAIGRVIWYNFGSREGDASYYFVAGVLFKEMAAEDKKRWEVFTRNTALKTGKIWQQMQFASTLTFATGIVLFIVGFYSEVTALAKTGIFLSLIALIGFVIAWWQHRSHLHLKKYKLF